MELTRYTCNIVSKKPRPTAALSRRKYIFFSQRLIASLLRYPPPGLRHIIDCSHPCTYSIQVRSILCWKDALTCQRIHSRSTKRDEVWPSSVRGLDSIHPPTNLLLNASILFSILLAIAASERPQTRTKSFNLDPFFHIIHNHRRDFLRMKSRLFVIQSRLC